MSQSPYTCGAAPDIPRTIPRDVPREGARPAHRTRSAHNTHPDATRREGREIAHSRYPRRCSCGSNDLRGWRTRSASSTPEFFPGCGQSVEPAEALCRACLCRADCLAFALADPDAVGVWGGTSPRERARLRVGKVSTPAA